MQERFYTILGLPYSASDNEVKKAYKQLAKKYHPDINPSPEAHDRFLLIQEAYEHIINKKTIANSAPNSYYVKQEKKRRYETFIRKVRIHAQRKARKRYMDFRNSGLFGVVKGILALLFLVGFGFLLLPFYAYFFVKEKGILISIFCVPIGMHIMNIIYQHYLNLYTEAETEHFWVERIKNKYLSRRRFALKDYMAFAFTLVVILMYLLVYAGIKWYYAIAIGIVPFFGGVFLYVLAKKKEDEEEKKA
jgi:hypothetical protein